MSAKDNDAKEDRAYLAGMEAGWKYGYERNVEGFRLAQESRRKELRDAAREGK